MKFKRWDKIWKLVLGEFISIVSHLRLWKVGGFLLAQAHILLDHLVDLHAHLLVYLLFNEASINEQSHQKAQCHKQDNEKDSEP